MTVVRLVFLLTSIGLALGDDGTYVIGTGRYDITGPSTQIEMVIILTASYI